jgi:hypothetical protein
MVWLIGIPVLVAVLALAAFAADRRNHIDLDVARIFATTSTPTPRASTPTHLTISAPSLAPSAPAKPARNRSHKVAQH